MGYTIAHLSRRIVLPTASAILLLALIAGEARAQGTPSGPEDAFAKGRWRAEFLAQAALEAWNYNPSHEELYGLVQGVTYGLRDGLTLIAGSGSTTYRSGEMTRERSASARDCARASTVAGARRRLCSSIWAWQTQLSHCHLGVLGSITSRSVGAV